MNSENQWDRLWAVITNSHMTWDDAGWIALYAYTFCGVAFWPLTIALIEAVALPFTPELHRPRVKELALQAREKVLMVWVLCAVALLLYTCATDLPGVLRSQKCRYADC